MSSRRQGGHVVDHRGERRARRRGPREALWSSSPTARRAGHEVVLVCSGAIAAGLPPLQPERAPRGRGDAAGDRRGGSAAAHGAHRCDPGRARPRRRAGAADAARLRPAVAVPARTGDLAPVAGSGRGSRGERERHRSPTTRSATATTTGWPPSSRTWWLRSCSCCSPTPRVCSPPTRASTSDASLIEEIVEVDAALESVAGGAGTARGSGGMASKLAAAKIAAWSGVRVVIAAAEAPDVVRDAISEQAVGTAVRPRQERLSSRKLWIAFALRRERPDRRRRRGAAARSPSRGARCCPRGCARSKASSTPTTRSRSSADGAPFAKGLVRYAASALRAAAGRRTGDLPEGAPHEVIHRDDLVVLTT